jgi:ABC-type bacteriocin/lantibiotic exporter with double-glycine peptidase domain
MSYLTNLIKIVPPLVMSIIFFVCLFVNLWWVYLIVVGVYSAIILFYFYEENITFTFDNKEKIETEPKKEIVRFY